MPAPQYSNSLSTPTAARWRIVGLLAAYAVFCHFNRVSISVAGAEQIIGDEVSATQMGAVYSAYLLAYTLCMAPAGWLIDRRGPRFALAVMGFGSAILVAMTGVSAAMPRLILSLLVVRSLLGAVSAPMHPAAARMVSYWFPYAAQPLANAVVTAGALVGVASTYLIFGGLMDVFDWPAAFLILGIATAALAIGWTVYARNRPSEHRASNRAERLLVELQPGQRQSSHQPEAVEQKWEDTDGGLRDAQLHSPFRNPRLWLLTVSYGALGYFQYLFFYWQQFYFEKVLELEQTHARTYATVSTLAMAGGMLAGGWVFARFVGIASPSRRWLLPAAGLAASGGFVLLGTFSHEPRWVLVSFTAAMAAAGLSEGSFWTTAVELGGTSGGLSAAIMNTGGNAGGAVAPVLTPLLAGYLGWQGGIAFASAFCFLAAVLWRWIVPPRLDHPMN